MCVLRRPFEKVRRFTTRRVPRVAVADHVELGRHILYYYTTVLHLQELEEVLALLRLIRTVLGQMPTRKVGLGKGRDEIARKGAGCDHWTATIGAHHNGTCDNTDISHVGIIYQIS